jgi:hypothetical protein
MAFIGTRARRISKHPTTVNTTAYLYHYVTARGIQRATTSPDTMSAPSTTTRAQLCLLTR